MELMNLSCEGFLEELASKAAAPGGGGASALVGAAGVALGSMVGSLTVGKKKYAAVEADIIALNVRAEALRDQVSQLDAAAQEETSAMAVLENSLSHDKQTLERLDRELADTQQRAGNLRAQADALTDRIDQIDAETQDLARQLEELMDALRQLAESAGMKAPFTKGSLTELSRAVADWIEQHQVS